MDTTNIKFDPEELSGWAQRMESYCNDVNAYFEAINNKYHSLTSQWQGASLDAFIEKVKQLEQAKTKTLSDLCKAYQELYRISGYYKSAQGTAAGTAESLPVSGIFNV